MENDYIPEDWVDSQLDVESLDDIEVPTEPDTSIEGVTDGTESTDLITPTDTTEVEITVEGEESSETYETEFPLQQEFVPVKAYHYDEWGNFVVDEY